MDMLLQVNHMHTPHRKRLASTTLFGLALRLMRASSTIAVQTQFARPKAKAPGSYCPSCNSEAMAMHLEEISIAVAPGAHAILVLDIGCGVDTSSPNFPRFGLHRLLISSKR